MPKRQASMIRSHAQHQSIHAVHAKAHARMLMLAQGCPSSRLLLKRVEHMCAASITRSLSHTAPSHHKLTHYNVSHPNLNPKP